MRVLLVEPAYRRRALQTAAESADWSDNGSRVDDERLWYPPLGLLKLSRYHKLRGDSVSLTVGCDASTLPTGDLIQGGSTWDRIYITTLFTFTLRQAIDTINFYKQAVGGTTAKLFVGGIAATILPDSIFEQTGVYPIRGILTSSTTIGMTDDVNIDTLCPDYDVVASRPYAIQDTYYAYTSRGCVNHCPWCAVPTLEPTFVPYIDIRPSMIEMRRQYGDKARLKLMDNNVLASPALSSIVDDLLSMGYGRGDHTETRPKKQRVVDFNQGLDASFITQQSIECISKLHIAPFRVAFDRISEKDSYVRAIELAVAHGFRDISNYMLFNYSDTPRDLYDRLQVNIALNERYASGGRQRRAAQIFCYPMRYAPISDSCPGDDPNVRDRTNAADATSCDWLANPSWTKRFLRNIEIMKGAAQGAISSTPSLARRTIGHSFEEFLANLYMPEVLLRYRNQHEKRVYAKEPRRTAGTGDVEAFRKFILRLLDRRDDSFEFFHNSVASNSRAIVSDGLRRCRDKEMAAWFRLYLEKR